MKIIKSVLIYLVLFIAISYAVDSWRSRGLPSGPIDAFTLVTLEQQQTDVVALSHEQPVLVYFWATWCPICDWVSPSINWLSESHQVVSVAIRSGTDERVKHFLGDHDYQFVTVNDNTGELARRWQVTATPTVAIIANGEIVSYTTGASTPVGLWLRLWWAQLTH